MDAEDQGLPPAATVGLMQLSSRTHTCENRHTQTRNDSPKMHEPREVPEPGFELRLASWSGSLNAVQALVDSHHGGGKLDAGKPTSLSLNQFSYL